VHGKVHHVDRRLEKQAPRQPRQQRRRQQRAGEQRQRRRVERLGAQRGRPSDRRREPVELAQRQRGDHRG
jgi:hypothetical protein